MLNWFKAWRYRRVTARRCDDIEHLVLWLDANPQLRDAMRKALRVRGSEHVEPTLRQKQVRF